MFRNGAWTTFGPGFDGGVHAICIHNGTLWAGGDFFDAGDFSEPMNGLASWNGDVWMAASSEEFSGSINALFSDKGVLYAAGQFDRAAGIPARGVMALKDGSWSEVAGGLYGMGYSLGSFDGKLWVGGSFDRAGSTAAQGIAILDPSANTWFTVGKGAYTGWRTEIVRAIATTGELVYVGGNFRTMAGLRANHVAVYNRQTRRWSTLGAGVDGFVYSLATVGDKLYVGGQFDRAGDVAVRNLAVWDPATSTWSAVGDGGRSSVSALATDGSSLYACTGYVTTGSSWYRQMRMWDGTSWTTTPGEIQGYVNSLLFHDGVLYAGGNIGNVEDVDMNNVMEFDGSNWQPLGNGLSNVCYGLAFSNGLLYAAGSFGSADGQTVHGVAFWDGATWNPMGDGLDYSAYAITAAPKGGVYIGGGFTQADGVNAAHVVTWDGSSYSDLAGGVNRTVLSLATDPTALYAGGWLFEAGSAGVTSNHIAALRGAGLHVTESESNGIRMRAHTDQGRLTVDLLFEGSQAAELEVVDILGRSLSSAVSPVRTSASTMSFDTRSWPEGTYLLRATTSAGLTINGHVEIVH